MKRLQARSQRSGAHINGSLEFRDVFYARRGGPVVLNGFTLSIVPGEVIALVGRSGAGKTTALKLVNRLLLPDQGDVIVAGTDTRAWDPIRLRRSIGYVIQDAGLFPHFTVSENIAVVPKLEQWDAGRIERRTHELLEMIGLPPAAYSHRLPDELSGGERQRVGVARALAADPAVLLMDEPFGALDPITRGELQREFQRIQKQLRKTVLMVTHDMAEAERLADRVVVLDGGKVASDLHPRNP